MPENQSVYNALEQFKQARVKYGIVTDEFGGIQGIVTLKDIMEGLIGQVPDVGEEAEVVERLTEPGWWTDNTASMISLNISTWKICMPSMTIIHSAV